MLIPLSTSESGADTELAESRKCACCVNANVFNNIYTQFMVKGLHSYCALCPLKMLYNTHTHRLIAELWGATRYLAQGHLDMHTRGAGSPITDLLIGGQPLYLPSHSPTSSLPLLLLSAVR